jgi:protein tyrosine phosphatase (PTP) superfamily phosphohydrolase (DUF442 family)
MSLIDITNYLEIPGLAGTAGQPTRGQFGEIRAAGFELVINLAMPDSPDALADEAALVEGLGMGYVHIPVVWVSPGDADLDAFISAMQAARGRKTFAHCVLNMRVSSFMYIYRVAVLGQGVEAARWDMLSIWEPDATWQGFIDNNLLRLG